MTEKVKVRIAIAIMPSGEWAACGWAECKGWQEAMKEVNWDTEAGENRYWLTVELPVPQKVETVEILADMKLVEPAQ